VNLLSSQALDYLDDLFDQEALDEYTQPDLNIEPRPVTQPQTTKEFSEDKTASKRADEILSKSVLKKKVKFETGVEGPDSASGDPDEEDGYEADAHQASGTERLDELAQDQPKADYDDEDDENDEESEPESNESGGLFDADDVDVLNADVAADI